MLNILCREGEAKRQKKGRLTMVWPKQHSSISRTPIQHTENITIGQEGSQGSRSQGNEG
jgi:hypothetical protein